jgi:hypothetical protein
LIEKVMLVVVAAVTIIPPATFDTVATSPTNRLKFSLKVPDVKGMVIDVPVTGEVIALVYKTKGAGYVIQPMAIFD